MDSAEDKKYPYNEARLVIPDKKSKDQRWYIKFYVWDKSRGAKVMMRRYDINAITDTRKRLREGEAQCAEINSLLAEGYIFDNEAKEELTDERAREKNSNASISKLIKDFQEEIKYLVSIGDMRESTSAGYLLHTSHFLEYLKKKSLDQVSCSFITARIIIRFLEYMIDKSDRFGPRYYNNYVSSLVRTFNFGKKEGYLKENPAMDVPRKRVPKGRNVAYTPSQQIELMNYMKAEKPYWLFLSLFMHDTIMRTNEIFNLRVENLFQYSPEKLYLPVGFAKNKIERHVTLTPKLLSMIKELGIDKFPPHYYIFSKNAKPSSKPYKSKYAGHRYRVHVLDKVGGYSTDFTLYSWKHTGVIAAKLAGVSEASIIEQGGWKDVKSYYVYLKSLGQFANEDVTNKWPTPAGL